ncbi:unnamed protein product [Pylaiella littoralis]
MLRISFVWFCVSHGSATAVLLLQPVASGSSLEIRAAAPLPCSRCLPKTQRPRGWLAAEKMIFKSPAMTNMLFQGFHLHCISAPTGLSSTIQLEGIEDILPADVDVIERWIELGVVSRQEGCSTTATQASQGLSERALPLQAATETTR